MKRLAILVATVCAMGLLVSESQAQHHHHCNGGNRGFSSFNLSIGNGGFYGPGFGYGGFGGGYYNAYRPVYGGFYPAPVVPVAPVYGGFYGGGCGYGRGISIGW